MNPLLAKLLCNLIAPRELRHKARKLLLSSPGASPVPQEPSSFPTTSKRTDRLEFFKTATGNYWLPADAHGDVIAQAIKNNGVFDAEIYNMGKKFIRPDTAALDIGSNFGQMAIMMARHVGDNGVVHAFEADPFVFSILSKNIEENKAKAVVHQGAVHDTGGETLPFPVQDFDEFQTYGSYGIDYSDKQGGAATRKVATIRIDDLQFDMPISFMKIDVQGGDLFVMKGARETIARHRMPILFEYEFLFEARLGLSFQEYVDFVAEINYRFVRVIQGQNYLILPREASELLFKRAFDEE